MEALWTFFLNERFWLPANITWADFTRIEQEDNVKLTNPKDLLYAFPLAALIYVIRVLFERYIAKPIGHFLGIHDTKARITAKKNKNITTASVLNSSTKTDENQSYKRQPLSNSSKVSSSSKKRSSAASRLTKFTESCWRFTFYLSAFIYGLVVLRHKSWTWDTRYCWLGFPNQPVTADIFWYYIIELAFYWSLLFSQFFDVKRKDFWEMFLHHIATIALLSFSYIANFVRVGSLVLVIHDCADYWLEGAKMGVYVRSKKWSDTMFVIFTIVWFITRICYFPYKILYTTAFEGVSILGSCPAYYVFNGLLMLLYVLHCFWFYLICVTAITAVKTGEVSDERSESEDNNDDDNKDK